MISHDKHLNYRSPKLETEPTIDIGRRLYSLGNKDLNVGGGGVGGRVSRLFVLRM